MGRKRQLDKEQVLGAIHDWLVEHGVPPTIEELRAKLKVGSTRTIVRYLQWLEEDGDIERWPGARGLKLLRSSNKGLETIPVPLVGEAPAGPLMVAEENIEGWFRLPKASLKPNSAKFFLLRVRGNSMNQATVAGKRIESGDIVVVRQQPTAEKGDIVVALTDGEATIKHFEPGPGYYILRPKSSDPQHQPIIVDHGFSIAGVVRCVLKKGADAVSDQTK
jgi:repressor LexA